MAILVSCFECSKTVSSEAPRCPHCGTNYPIGVKCTVCCQNLRRSQAKKQQKEFGGAENRIEVKFFHESCYQQVNQIRIGRGSTSCPVCRVGIEFETASSVSCQNCGQNFATNLSDPVLAFCYYCNFRLNTNLEVALKEESRPFLDGWVTETVYAHKICHTPERQKAEQDLLKQEHLDKLRFEKQKQARISTQKAEKNRKRIGLAITSGLVLGIVVGGVGGVILNVIFALGFSLQSIALFGFCSVFIVTLVAFLIFSWFR
jgi:F0F1-type ATP synthase assembly protein I